MVVDNKKQLFLVFLSVFSIAIAFAIFTDHRWEDWYITFRAAKNLALGNGLVFTIGERVHSFTSPIGTLLPALFSYILDNKSDEAVIWMFRFTSASALGATAVILWSISEKLRVVRPVKWLLLGMFSTNILIIDFSINGMETAFMMLFLAIALHTILIPSQKQISHLCVALTGIIYTRPDGFVYVGAIMLGAFLFTDWQARKELLINYTKAVAIALAIYIPWLIMVWSYYGTPIPHTIIAKGTLHSFSLIGLVVDLFKFPFTYWTNDIGKMIFLPPYSNIGGWQPLQWVNLFISGIVVSSLLIPGIGRRAKAISLAVILISFYLTHISGQGPMPWYLPNLAIISILGLALFADKLFIYLTKNNISVIPASFFVSVLLLFSLATLLLGAISMRHQQKLIEFGNRQQIGLWLQEHAEPGQTVFLECLGYIGYFSNLKTYDFPGMSSPEIVAARKRLRSNDFGILIGALKPDWLVLRPAEEKRIEQSTPGLIDKQYILVNVFDVTNTIKELKDSFGKPYMLYDAKFMVYKKVSQK